MEISMLAIVIIAFGQLLRLVTCEHFTSIKWSIRNKVFTKYVVRLIVLIGWLIIAFGRLVLYLSFLPLNGSFLLLLMIAIAEIVYSIYISVKVKHIRIWYAILLDISLATIVGVYVYKLLGIVSSLIFVI